MSKPHIAYLSNIMSIHDVRFLDKLAEKDYRVSLIVTDLKRIASPFYQDIAKHTKIHVINLANQQMPLDDPYRGDYKPSVEQTVAQCRKVYAQQLKQLLQKIKPDVLHSGFLQTDSYLAARSGFHPLLMMPWGSDVLINPFSNQSNRQSTEWTLQQADAICCDCEYVHAKLIELLPNLEKANIEVFPWGIDLRRFKPENPSSKLRAEIGIPENAFVFIMSRAFRPIYRVDLFLQAIHSLKRQSIDNLAAVVLGDGPLREEFETFISKHHLQREIKLIPHIPNEQLPDYLNLADCYVSASQSDGSSLSLLEAMACSLPTILSNIPANNEWLVPDKGGYLFDVDDGDGLAQAMQRIMQKDHQAMGRHNLTIARNRANWDRNFEVVESLYEQLLSGSSIRPSTQAA